MPRSNDLRSGEKMLLQQLFCRVEPEVWEIIRDRAYEDERSMSWLVARIVTNWAEAHSHNVSLRVAK